MPSTHDDIVARVEHDFLDAEGAFHVDGVYYAMFGDADLARRRFASRVADTVSRAHAWALLGATRDGVSVRPTPGSVPQLLERCPWCGLRFTPGAPAVSVAGRHLHDRACREAFDRSIAESELDRAQEILRLVEARDGRCHA